MLRLNTQESPARVNCLRSKQTQEPCPLLRTLLWNKRGHFRKLKGNRAHNKCPKPRHCKSLRKQTKVEIFLRKQHWAEPMTTQITLSRVSLQYKELKLFMKSMLLRWTSRLSPRRWVSRHTSCLRGRPTQRNGVHSLRKRSSPMLSMTSFTTRSFARLLTRIKLSTKSASKNERSRSKRLIKKPSRSIPRRKKTNNRRLSRKRKKRRQ